MATFDLLVSRLMSDSNAERNEAEASLQEMEANHPDQLCAALLHNMRYGSDPAGRQLCSLILRRLLNRGRGSIWPRLSADTHETIKRDILILTQLPSEPEVQKVCHVITALGAHILPEGRWPELLPFLVQLTKAPSELQRRSGLNIFGGLIQALAEDMRAVHEQLRQIFVEALGDVSYSVRLAALTNVSFFLIVAREQRPNFQPLLPTMLDIVGTFISRQEEAAARSALTQFIELAGMDADFMRPHLDLLIDAMLSVLSNSALEDETRHMALEFLVSVAEGRPAMIRKKESTIQRLIPILLEMIHDLEDNPDWNEGEEADLEDANSEFGAEALDRLSIALGGQTITPQLFTFVPQMLVAPDWKQRHAAVMAISVTGEGCAAFLAPHLSRLVEMVLPRLSDESPRVRWAACNAIGQMASDFGSKKFQDKFHAVVLPALTAVMDDVANPRVQSHAAAAVINFCEHAKDRHLLPYCHALLGKMGALLTQNNKIVLEQTITAIAAVADVIQQQFVPYYPSFMPYLKSVLTQATSREFRYLRGKTMEAISLIAVAVGKEVFAPDAKEVLDAMLQAQSEPMEADDPQITYLQQAWARLCKALGQDFVPYLPAIIPQLLTAAAIQPHIVICNHDERERYEEEGKWEFIPLADRQVAIKTSVLEQKSQACNMLYCYVEELREGFFPYVNETTSLFVPLLSFYYHDGVRSAAALAMPCLLQSTRSHLEATGADPRLHMTQLFQFILPELLSAAELEMDMDILVLMVEALGNCITIVDPSLLMGENIMKIFTTIITLVREHLSRRADREAHRADPDFDEEEAERLEQQHEREEELLGMIGEVISKIIVQLQGNFLPIFQELVQNPVFLQLCSPTSRAKDRQVVLCTFDDVVVHCGTAAAPYYGEFLKAFLTYARDPAGIVRQAAIFGIGTIAQLAPQDFQPFVPDALTLLVANINAPDAKEEDIQPVTDNAVSALSKLCLTFPTAIGEHLEQLIMLVVSHMPVTVDLDEAVIVHEHLCQYLSSYQALLLGENYVNLPRILAIIASVIHTEFATDETSQKLLTICNSLPRDAVEAALTELGESAANLRAALFSL